MHVGHRRGCTDPTPPSKRHSRWCSTPISTEPDHADEGQITQILINLVKNAVQADARNVVITAQLTPSEQTVISVTNDGLPISRESQDEIFVPFYTTKQEGTGIGLSLSRQIMRLHNGSLALTKSDESGTVFTLLFR